jgi:hypothetical protein
MFGQGGALGGIAKLLLVLDGHLPQIDVSHHDLLIRRAKPRAVTEFFLIARAGKLFEKPEL